MIGVLFLFVLGIVWLAFASVCDLRRNEIPNWVSFSLVIFALGFRFFYSLFSDAGFDFFYMGLLGGGIFYGMANLLYYSRMYAGGDAKLFAALGAVIPFSGDFFVNLRLSLVFVFLFFLVGGIYGLMWSGVLSIRNFRKFKKEFSKQFRKRQGLFKVFLGLGIVIFLLGFFNWILFYSGGMILMFVLLYLHAKSVEEICFVKNVSGRELVEGDWLYKDVRVGRKTIKEHWEGLGKKEIDLIKKSGKKVKIKFGIPFVPVFLISYVLLLYLELSGFSPVF